jgi:uncharacterized protein
MTIFQMKSLTAVFTLNASILTAVPVQAKSADEALSVASGSVVTEFLANIVPDKVDTAAKRLVAGDATYISLNSGNPELKKIMPWACTIKSPEAFSYTFSRASYWDIHDFTITSKIAFCKEVAILGNLTYRPVAVYTEFTRAFSIHDKVRDANTTYFQFMEDTYSSNDSYRLHGSLTIKTT